MESSNEFPVAQLILIATGLVLLMAGRKIFWLLLAALGFVLGTRLATNVLAGYSDWTVLIVALVLGVVGAALAIMAQKLAVGLAGLVVGGFVVQQLITELGVATPPWHWLGFVLGGIAGAMLAVLLFKSAVVVLSCLVGAALIIEAMNLTEPVSTTVFFVLLVAGIVIQSGVFRRKKAPARDTARGKG